MNISEMIFNMHVKIKIVHSIPGRLRLHIPLSKKIPKEWHIDEEHFEAIKIINGIKKFEFCYTTSNLLIKYDPKITDEKSIIHELKTLAKIAHNHRHKFEEVSIDAKHETVEKMIKLVEADYHMRKQIEGEK